MNGDGSVLLGLLLLAVAAIPVVIRRVVRRRRLIGALASTEVQEVPTDPAFANHPSRPRTFQLRLGNVDATGTWRPETVQWLLGRNGVIAALDVTVLGALAWAAWRSPSAPAAWYAILAGAALLPIASLALAVWAMARGGDVWSGPSRADVVAAWVGGAVLLLASVVAWIVLVLVGLGLLLGG